MGLQQSEGLAAGAMSQAGVDGESLRQRVSVLYERTSSANKVNKVPFSVEAKRCLEQSLRVPTMSADGSLIERATSGRVAAAAARGEGSAAPRRRYRLRLSATTWLRHRRQDHSRLSQRATKRME